MNITIESNNINKELVRYIEDEIFPLYDRNEEGHIYGMIISTADRTIVDIDNTIKRTYSYGKKNYAELPEEEQLERVYEHLTEKYGENGYAKIYLEDREFDEAIKKLRQALSNKEEFIKRVKRVVDTI